DLLADQLLQVGGEVGSRFVDGLALANQATQFLLQPLGARFEHGVGERHDIRAFLLAGRRRECRRKRRRRKERGQERRSLLHGVAASAAEAAAMRWFLICPRTRAPMPMKPAIAMMMAPIQIRGASGL